MIKKLSALLVCFIIFFLLFAMCCCARRGGRQGAGSADEEGKLHVVTTILPLYDAAVNVGGDLVLVHNLLPSGSSPHTYEPTPDDLREIENSDVIIKLGLGLDDWMNKIVSASGSGKDNVLTASEGIATIPVGDDNHADHEAGEPDPHIWMDPLKMIEISGNVRDAFIKKMPGKKDVFEKNYENYKKKLEQLDDEFRETLSRFDKKEYVTFHPFMNYMAKRYELHQAATITESPGQEPGPERLIEIVKLLKEKNVKVVFIEPQFSPKASEAIAREIGGGIMVVDPLGSLDDPERDTYVKNMKKNLEALTEAFNSEN